MERIDLSSQSRPGAQTTEDRGGSRWRASMVAFQVALSIFLLIGSGLLMRSLARQTESELGFRPENLLVSEIQIPENNYPEPPRQLAFFRTLLQEVRSGRSEPRTNVPDFQSIRFPKRTGNMVASTCTVDRTLPAKHSSS
jgi:hypothetical protein